MCIAIVNNGSNIDVVIVVVVVAVVVAIYSLNVTVNNKVISFPILRYMCVRARVCVCVGTCVCPGGGGECLFVDKCVSHSI